MTGHLEVLKWAEAKGCPWDSSTCASAAKGGRLEFLKWAREKGVLGTHLLVLLQLGTVI